MSVENNQISAWQPMDTAPTNCPILLYMSSGAMFVGQWVKNPMTGDIAWVIAELPDNDRLLVKNPLHWAALPKPPAELI